MFTNIDANNTQYFSLSKNHNRKIFATPKTRQISRIFFTLVFITRLVIHTRNLIPGAFFSLSDMWASATKVFYTSPISESEKKTL